MFGKLVAVQHHSVRPKEFREDYTILVEVWEIIHGEIPVWFPSDCRPERPTEVCLSNLNLWVRTWYTYLLLGYFWRQRLLTQEWTAAFVPVCLTLICNILWEAWAHSSTRSRASWAAAHMFKPARMSHQAEIQTRRKICTPAHRMLLRFFTATLKIHMPCHDGEPAAWCFSRKAGCLALQVM